MNIFWRAHRFDRLIKINVCCSDLSGFRINEVEECPDSGKNKLFAPGTQKVYILHINNQHNI